MTAPNIHAPIPNDSIWDFKTGAWIAEEGTEAHTWITVHEDLGERNSTSAGLETRVDRADMSITLYPPPNGTTYDEPMLALGQLS